MQKLILASASPRRREILQLLDIPFKVIAPKQEITIDSNIPLDKAVLNVARSKALEVSAAYPEYTVIGADTIVSIDGVVLGKPKNSKHAREMLQMLSGRIHSVMTAVWVFGPGLPDGGSGFTDTAKVEFYPLSKSEIDEYIETGEPADKAGGYGIQGKGMRLVRAVYGDFYTVMGLPGARLWRLIKGKV
ncbi:MAG: Maf family protein [Oscillospiraceae bacterium]|nr:Maf family protein [Oscillospiraceae bacterium]